MGLERKRLCCSLLGLDSQKAVNTEKEMTKGSTVHMNERGEEENNVRKVREARGNE